MSNRFDVIQYVKAHPTATQTTDQKNTLECMRSSITSRLEDCYQTSGRKFHQHRQALEEPESIALNLPSSFARDEHRDRGLLIAAELEWKLREVFAHQAIKKLKCEIMLKLANIQARQIHVSGQ